MCIVIASRIVVWWAFRARAPERGFAAFFVAVICKWVWLPAAAVWLPSTPIPGAHQEAQSLDRDEQKLK